MRRSPPCTGWGHSTRVSRWASSPQGTGNDLARALGLPLDPVESGRAVLTGSVRPLDLLRSASDGVVVNAVHAGTGARAGAVATSFKERLGAAAFPLGAAIAGLTTPGWPLRVEVAGCAVASDDGDWVADGSAGVLMLAVCNGSTIGGGTPIAPEAAPEDGRADVVVCTATGPVARSAFGRALLRGEHGNVVTSPSPVARR
jgi:diacylglycerol kinase family enzyme